LRRLTALEGALVSTLLMLAALGAAPAAAQSAGLTGAVADSAGHPLGDARLELTTPQGQSLAHTNSDPNGQFALPAEPPGSYTLTITRAGFKPASQSVSLSQSTPAPLAIALIPGQSEAITVEAARPSGPSLSSTGANRYSINSQDILRLPAGTSTNLTDVLAQMPGVAIDQNQQIHIRNTEGPQFQYQINGILVPLDINTNPPFVSMINPQFISQLDLLDGILPSRYSYATGGIVDIQTKDGCQQPGGSLTILGGQRGTFEPSANYAGCAGDISYFVSGLYNQSNTAYSSATPGANAIHDNTNEGQFFGIFTDRLDQTTKLSFIASAAGSNNQLPNVPNLPTEFTLSGANNTSSADINSYLNFRDYLGILSLSGAPTANTSYQLAYTVHSIAQNFKPDNASELIFQGVASTASDHDFDNTLEGDFTWDLGRHSLSTGFYLGDYRVDNSDSSLVFPVDANGNQSSDVPVHIGNTTRETNIISGLYLNDSWQLADGLRANIGLRWDALTGFTRTNQFDPTLNLTYHIASNATIHAGFARYMEVPSFRGISATATVDFANTTAASPPGIANPLTEDDYEWDVGIVYRPTSTITLSNDNFYETTRHYLDTGQFGVVPIFAPFNYSHGYIWGTELSASYKEGNITSYANLTIGRNMQEGVATGQFNFDPDELAFIDSHHIVLDHQPLVGATAGLTYDWKPYSFGIDATYSSGLVGGFADQDQLPTVFQVNLNVERSFELPVVGTVIDRVIIYNLLDRTNLIRPSEGIGIFQSAYGPRFTVLNALTIPL
jgi:TonB dependent receptor/Carboxypeptidase regulatory-like domain/TonB-dependent Receptor Plug Domain